VLEGAIIRLPVEKLKQALSISPAPLYVLWHDLLL